MRMIIAVIGLLTSFSLLVTYGKMFGNLNKDKTKIYAHIFLWTVFWELFKFMIRLVLRG